VDGWWELLVGDMVGEGSMYVCSLVRRSTEKKREMMVKKWKSVGEEELVKWKSVERWNGEDDESRHMTELSGTTSRRRLHVI
jgi:hypothetical protein